MNNQKKMLENIKVIPILVPEHHLFPDLNSALGILKEHQSNFQTTNDKKNIHDILWNN